MEVAGEVTTPVFARQSVSVRSMSWQSTTGNLHVLLLDSQGGRGALHVHIFNAQGHEQRVWSPSTQPASLTHHADWWSSDCTQLLVSLTARALHDCCFLNMNEQRIVPLHMPSTGLASTADLMFASICSGNSKAALLFQSDTTNSCTLIFYECQTGHPLTAVNTDATLQPGHLMGALQTTFTSGDDQDVAGLKLSCWLPTKKAFLIPIEDSTAADGMGIDFGILSLSDGVCTPLACGLSDACHVDVSINDIREVVVSPNGRHAAVFLNGIEDNNYVAGCFLDLEQGYAFISEFAFILRF